MKGEYVEDQQHQHHDLNHNPHPHHNHTMMFSKFPPYHLHNHPTPPKFQPHHNFPPQHPFPLPHKSSEDSDTAATSSAPTTTPTPPSKKPKTTTTTTSSEDAGTVEVSRRHRGRPPGSKNKPKPSIVITHDPPEPAMAPCILEVPSGSDIIDSLTRFTRRRNTGLCVLTAYGDVANVTLKQPSTSGPAGTVTFHGRFDVLSLSAVMLLQTVPFFANNNSNNGSNGNNGGFIFTISLAGPQGQIVGGKVVGPLHAAGTVYIIAVSFNSPSYHRLPVEDQEVQNPSAGGDGQSSSPASVGEDGSGSGGGGGGPMGMYSCHMGSTSSDVIWPPTARPPQRPPY